MSNDSSAAVCADRWEAVRNRQASADGQFFYGVRTTGIFCRPSCASRQPLRKNVEFFQSAQQAAAAGFRPCRRCKPTDASDATAVKIVQACRALAADEPMKIEAVAKRIGWSESYFLRRFKKALGVTPTQFRRRLLAERGRASLAKARSVIESVYAAGYSSSSRFYDNLGRELGMTPAVAVGGGPGQVVHYAAASCSLGRIIVAWTSVGVCDVSLGESEGDLLRRLQRRLPNADVTVSNAGEWVEALVAIVDQAVPKDIPLDMRGTAFQERVWQQLRQIPPGQTRSYSQVASDIGEPKAARAVAQACAANVLAVVVPCHRVVCADGGTGGYRWGANRKRQLLERESES